MSIIMRGKVWLKLLTNLVSLFSVVYRVSLNLSEGWRFNKTKGVVVFNSECRFFFSLNVESFAVMVVMEEKY